jgi:hypothetical protein
MRAFANTLRFVGALLLVNALQLSIGWSQNNPPQAAALDTDPVGKVESVSGTVHVTHPSAVLVQANLPAGDGGQTKIGDLVYRGDVIETGVDGAVGITFADGSAVNFSPSAKMEVTEFLYDPRGNSNSTLISLTEGTFSFISGAIAKTGQMKIDTPVGTLGIRGTAPRVEISKDGSVKFTTMIEEK